MAQGQERVRVEETRGPPELSAVGPLLHFFNQNALRRTGLMELCGPGMRCSVGIEGPWSSWP